MRRIIFDALIQGKGARGICTSSAKLLIAFKSSRMAQPVLISEPDPGTGTQQHPMMGRGTLFDEAHHRDYQAVQA
jgi:hypothetical protein